MARYKIKFTAEIEVDYFDPFAITPLEEQRDNLQRALNDRLLDNDPLTKVTVTDYKMYRPVADYK